MRGFFVYNIFEAAACAYVTQDTTPFAPAILHFGAETNISGTLYSL